MTPFEAAYFVSPHGFGHAARAAAVMAAVHRLHPEARFHVFTTVPRWFFEDSLDGPFEHVSWATDVGLVQRTSLAEDLPATRAALERFYPFTPETLDSLAAQLDGCRLVLADVSPLGLAAARHAGLPSVLVESFTWDWIYRAYLDAEPGLAPFAEAFAEIFEGASLRMQTEPVCHRVPGSLAVPPVARARRASRSETRRLLGVEPERPLVLVTMGGVPWSYTFLDALGCLPEAAFVIPGGAATTRREGNVLLLPERSGLYHPDLVAAADALVGKLGYSTVAEASQAGTPYAYVGRPAFPESPVLARFVSGTLPSFAIDPEAFEQAAWVERLPELWREPRPAGIPEDGAAKVAEAVLRLEE